MDSFLRTKEAARFLGLSIRTLQNYRLRCSDGPPWFRPQGSRLVLYRKSGLILWAEGDGPRRSTSQEPGQDPEAA